MRRKAKSFIWFWLSRVVFLSSAWKNASSSRSGFMFLLFSSICLRLALPPCHGGGGGGGGGGGDDVVDDDDDDGL